MYVFVHVLYTSKFDYPQTHTLIHTHTHVRPWPGRPGFNPRSSHTKDSKNGT